MSYGDYPDLAYVKKILIIKFRHLGDVLLTSPVFTVLRRAFPGATIDALVYEESIPMLKGHPAIDEVLGYDRKKGRGFGLNWEVRKRGYDLVIHLTEGDRGAFLSLFSGAKVRLGPASKGKLWAYTHKVKQCSSLRHTVERQLDSLRRMGVFPTEEEKKLVFAIPSDTLEKYRSYEGAVVIHPASRWRFKCWPKDKMRALAKELLRRKERVVFTSGPDAQEVEMVGEIASQLDAENLAGRLSIKELGAVVKWARLLICVDSMPLHLASALKTPLVALFGPTSEVTWGPWQHPKARVVFESPPCRPCYQDGCGGSKRSECLYALSLGKVLEAVEGV